MRVSNSVPVVAAALPCSGKPMTPPAPPQPAGGAPLAWSISATSCTTMFGRTRKFTAGRYRTRTGVEKLAKFGSCEPSIWVASTRSAGISQGKIT